MITRFLLLPVIACIACDKAPQREPAHAAAPDSPRVGAGRVGDAIGRWVVTGDTAPGISAMTSAKAREWHGRRATYGADVASFEADTCRRPTYESRSLDADSLFTQGFRVAPRDLGFPPGGQVRVTEVRCGVSEWSAPGSFLIWRTADEALTVWDGVFFILERSR